MRHATIFIACAFFVCTDCTYSNSRLTKCQAEKEQLLTAIRTQRDSNRTLQTQVASLDSRLDQAEKDLARSGTGTRLPSGPSRTAEPPSSAPQSTSPPHNSSTPVKSDGLPWRSPATKAEQAPAVDSRRSSVESSASSSLLALARRDHRVEYDADGRAARVDLPVSFEEKTATLTAEDKRQLDSLAGLLKSHEGRDVRVMVAGLGTGRLGDSPAKEGDNRFTAGRQLGVARAQAVADYLDRHGVAQERLAVTGAAARSAATSSGVQIYLFDADAPAVAFWPTDQPLRR